MSWWRPWKTIRLLRDRIAHTETEAAAAAATIYRLEGNLQKQRARNLELAERARKAELGSSSFCLKAEQMQRVIDSERGRVSKLNQRLSWAERELERLKFVKVQADQKIAHLMGRVAGLSSARSRLRKKIAELEGAAEELERSDS